MAESDTTEIAQNARKYWSAEGYTEGGVIREVDYAAQSGGLDPMFAGIKIVDTDTHITEAPDLFTSRAPAAWKDRMPHIKRVNGTDKWFVGDRDFGSMGGNVIRADNNKLLGRLAFPKLEDAHPGGHKIKERLAAMDDMGVYAQIGFQNSGVTQAGSLMSLGDPELALKVTSRWAGWRCLLFPACMPRCPRRRSTGSSRVEWCIRSARWSMRRTGRICGRESSARMTYGIFLCWAEAPAIMF